MYFLLLIQIVDSGYWASLINTVKLKPIKFLSLFVAHDAQIQLVFLEWINLIQEKLGPDFVAKIKGI